MTAYTLVCDKLSIKRDIVGFTKRETGLDSFLAVFSSKAKFTATNKILLYAVLFSLQTITTILTRIGKTAWTTCFRLVISIAAISLITIVISDISQFGHMTIPAFYKQFLCVVLASHEVFAGTEF